MPRQPNRGSQYDVYSSIGSTLEQVLKFNTIKELKDGIRTVIRICDENAVPLSERKKTKEIIFIQK